MIICFTSKIAFKGSPHTNGIIITLCYFCLYGWSALYWWSKWEDTDSAKNFNRWMDKKIMIFMHTIKNNIARKTLEGKYVNLEGITFNEIAE